MSDNEELIEITDLDRPYWEAMAGGTLTFQQCRNCGHKWLPPREECPSCLSPDHDWTPASGRGKLVSWVVYHHSFNEITKDWIPYNVAIVELEEGPRLISNIVDAENDALEAGQTLRLQPTPRGNVVLPCFSIEEEMS